MSMQQESEAIHGWAQQLLSTGEWIEVENRPWANDNCRDSITKCKGKDFVLHDPRLKFRFFWNEATGDLQGIVKFADSCEGNAMLNHGASTMSIFCAIFDEILAYPVWRRGEGAYTANVNVNLRRPVPLAAIVKFEAKIVKSEGRKRFLVGKVTNTAGDLVYGDATGLWIVANEKINSMIVYDQVIASDKARAERGEFERKNDFEPNAVQKGPWSKDVDIQASDDGLDAQFFVHSQKL